MALDVLYPVHTPLHLFDESNPLKVIHRMTLHRLISLESMLEFLEASQQDAGRVTLSQRSFDFLLFQDGNVAVIIGGADLVFQLCQYLLPGCKLPRINQIVRLVQQTGSGHALVANLECQVALLPGQLETLGQLLDEKEDTAERGHPGRHGLLLEQSALVLQDDGRKGSVQKGFVEWGKNVELDLLRSGRLQRVWK